MPIVGIITKTVITVFIVITIAVIINKNHNRNDNNINKIRRIIMYSIAKTFAITLERNLKQCRSSYLE